MITIRLAMTAFLFWSAVLQGQTFSFPGPASISGHSGGASPAGTSKACYTQAGSSPINCTWSSALASGETAACWVTNLGSTSSYALSDSGGNVYTANGGIQTGYGFWSQFFYSHAVAGAATTTATLTGSVNFFTIYCTSYTGGSGLPDGSVSYAGNSTGAANTVNITTSTTHSLEVCFGAYANGGSYGVDASFTRLTSSAPTNIAGAYKQLPGYGTYSATWTPPGSSASDLECGGYK
jgi:hypothetical protein